MPVDRVVLDWAIELAQYLNRSEAEIRNQGLTAFDFRSSDSVRIEYADDSHMQFLYAFSLISQDRNTVAIFTEHCGYFQFPLLVEMKVIRVQKNVYFHE